MVAVRELALDPGGPVVFLAVLDRLGLAELRVYSSSTTGGCDGGG